MRKRNLFITAFLYILTLSMQAQENYYGKVVDNKQQPISFANVALLNANDSSFVTGVTTDEEGKFMILSGHRRRLAQLYRIEHGMTDDTRVPIITREVMNPLDGIITSDEMETLNIVFPNKGSRRNFFPIEEAAEIALIKPIIRKIYDQQKASGEVTGKFRTFFASVLGISETTLQRKESVGKLSDAAKAAVEDGRMTATAAAELSSLSADAQDDALAMIDEEGMRPTIQAIKDQKRPQEQEKRLEEVDKKWSPHYPSAMRRWYDHWDVITPIFKFSVGVRTSLYTTNIIESLNASYRRLNRQRSVFPSAQA